MIDQLVLDASSAIRISMEAPESEASLAAILHADRTCVPALFMSETAHAVLRHVRAGDLEPSEAQERLLRCIRLVDGIGDDRALASKALSRALELGLSAYDAAYLELARELSCPLVTLDRRLGHAARSVGVEVLGH